ncbi:hypothetical protein PF008_g29114 [Phytophthora fragariae]|uniref:DDE-1 domain-containing protein n=1 Tax=Phytophthora fragariae TaxID=53985 RepID=A0A6G0Q9E9_9STRA|nr:hypothetical protein PF008_g29114 [Phytophthora fragariae]
MDAGIIAALKAGYRDKHMELVTKRIDPEMPEMTPKNKTAFYVDQLQAMRWTVGVSAAMEAKTIANCFRKTGIIFPEESAMPAPPTRRERVKLSDLLI